MLRRVRLGGARGSHVRDLAFFLQPALPTLSNLQLRVASDIFPAFNKDPNHLITHVADTMAALICPRATTACVRSINTRFALRKASSTPSLSFSTAAARPSRQNDHHHHRSMLQSSRSSSIINQTASWQPQQPTKPIISSRKTFSTTSIRPSSNPTATPRQHENDEVLTWDRFFALRKRRRYINLASSVFTGSAAVITFGPMVAQQDLDSWLAQLSGIDPFFVLGLTTFAVGLGGWLCGPTFGSAVFRMWTARKGWSAALAEVSIIISLPLLL